MPHLDDADAAGLATLSDTLRDEYTADDVMWVGSPFEWITQRPSRQKGAIGERLVEQWLTQNGFDVTRSPDAEADRIVNGTRIEIKFSTRWKNGVYKFQQLRDQNYAYAICIGVSPFGAHCWVLPKTEIMERWKGGKGGINAQHGGARGQDTAWLNVEVDTPAPWLSSFGGSLGDALVNIRKYLDPRQTTR